MSHFFNFLFSQYQNYSTTHILIEISGVSLGLLSVWFSKKDNILVFPTGIVSTLLFVYLLWVWQLFGDMMINGYYVIMSIYGWYVWTRKKNNNIETKISKTTQKEKKLSFLYFCLTFLVVYSVYSYFHKWNHWTAYIDTFTTAIFFVGMWLMAKKKIENWIYWIIGNSISVPLYFYKGLSFTSIQYLIFTLLAIWGYYTWKKHLYNNIQTS